MNALEQEYDDSVRRAALAGRRLRVRVWGEGVALVAGGWEAATAFAAKEWRVGVLASVATVAMLAALVGARAVAHRLKDRGTVAISTARETRSFRPVTRVRPLRWLAPVALLAVLAAFSPWLRAPARLAVDASPFVAVIVARVHVAWRARRRARIDLDWLDSESADAGEVRARERTK